MIERLLRKAVHLTTSAILAVPMIVVFGYSPAEVFA